MFFDPVSILIIINIAVFAIPYIVKFGYNTEQSIAIFQGLGLKNNAAIQDGEYYRLLTSTFLHGDLTHLLLNMFSLWQIGPGVLSIYRIPGFLAIYILSGLGGSLASYFYNANNSVGASGSIFGLIGALFSYSILSSNFGLLNNLVLVVVLNFAFSLSPGSRIDNFGHIGGLVTGIIVGGLILTLNKSLVQI